MPCSSAHQVRTPSARRRLAALALLPVACASVAPREASLAPVSSASAGASPDGVEASASTGSVPGVAASAPGASASVAGAVGAAGVEPPAREARVAWVMQPVDHTTGLRLGVAPEGGVAVAGNSEMFLGARDDMFVQRLSADGEVVWQKLGVGRFVRGVRAWEGGTVVATEFTGQVRLGGLQESAKDGSTDLFLGKFDGRGEPVWSARFGAPDFDRAADLALLADGGVALAHGAFLAPRKGPISFTIAGGEDTLVSRWSARGELVWVKSLGWPGYDEPMAILPSREGSVVAGGTRWKSASTMSSDLEQGPCQPWVVRLTSSGDVAWQTAASEPGKHTTLRAMAEGGAGQVVIAGSLRGATTIGATTVTAAKGQGYVAQLDANGQVAWARAAPLAVCVALSPGGQLYVVTSHEVFRVNATDEPVRVFQADPRAIRGFERCVLSGPDRLFVSGTASPDASLGDRKIGPPRTMRSPAWKSTDEASFVARLDL